MGLTIGTHNCKICGKEFTKFQLQRHIRMNHKYSTVQIKEYYDIHYKSSEEGTCVFSGAPTEFKGLSAGYSKYANTPEVLRLSRATNSVRFKTNVHGLSLEEATERFVTTAKEGGKNVSKTFQRRAKEDPTYLKSMSRYCKEFWLAKGHSEEEAIQLSYSATAVNRKKYRDKFDANGGKVWYREKLDTTLEYWLAKGLTMEEALDKRRERQQTFTLAKCIEKYGEEDGLARWNKRQTKWLSNYKKTNFSKVSQDLFWEVFSALSSQKEDLSSIFFATIKNGIRDDSGVNNELRLTLSTSNKTVMPDFIWYDKKKIIEFDGTYWHSADKRARDKNTNRDEVREASLTSEGFLVFRVKESDYHLTKDLVINQCISFLNE